MAYRVIDWRVKVNVSGVVKLQSKCIVRGWVRGEGGWGISIIYDLFPKTHPGDLENIRE